MSDNNEKQTPNDDFLDWNDYDEEYEEEDVKNDNQNEQRNQEPRPLEQKESAETEDINHNDTFRHNKSNRDYSYPNGIYKGSYSSSTYYNRTSFGNKKFNKQNSKPYNKGYDNNNTYYQKNTFYKKKSNNDDYYNGKDYYKYKKEYNKDYNNEYNKDYDYGKREYKTVEKHNYENSDNYDKKFEKRSFGDSRYHNRGNRGSGRNYYATRPKNNDYIKNEVQYITRQFNDDKKTNGKNNKNKSEFKHFEKEEELNEKTEEDISKPSFYNSKKINNNQIIEEAPIIQQKYIKTEDFIKIDNLVENITQIVRDTYINLKTKLNKNIEEQYGSLNIHAKTYIPRKKMKEIKNMENNMPPNNMNYVPPNVINNNVTNQNYVGPYY